MQPSQGTSSRLTLFRGVSPSSPSALASKIAPTWPRVPLIERRCIKSANDNMCTVVSKQKKNVVAATWNFIRQEFTKISVRKLFADWCKGKFIYKRYKKFALTFMNISHTQLPSYRTLRIRKPHKIVNENGRKVAAFQSRRKSRYLLGRMSFRAPRRGGLGNQQKFGSFRFTAV